MWRSLLRQWDGVWINKETSEVNPQKTSTNSSKAALILKLINRKNQNYEKTGIPHFSLQLLPG